MDNTIKILGICGSIRKESFNKKILECAQKNTPPDTSFDVFDIGILPFFNQDIESDPPASVVEFRDAVGHADALFIASNEYNFSISGVLKNAIEWGSRPYATSVLNHKPIAICGASTGMLGTARAQYHLRQMLVQTDSIVLNRPEVMIPFVKEKCDENGVLNDEKSIDKIIKLENALVEWTKKLRRGGFIT
jgi:chromate reductase